MKCIHLCSLRNVDFSDIVEFSFRFMHIHKPESVPLLNPNYFNEILLKQIGNLALLQFTRNSFFSMTEDATGTQEELIELHRIFKSRVNHFLSYLWFSKDNSTNALDIISHYHNPVLFVTHMSAGLSDSSGEFKSTKFNIDELIHTKNVYESIVKILPDNEAKSKRRIELAERPIVIESDYHYIDHSKTNKIERALSFLTMARSQSFLPLKISLYVAVLESLFTLEGGDIVHKVSERGSLYLGGTYEEKLENYKKIKAAYNVRSKFFHGQALEKKQATHAVMQKISNEVDTILRAILNKVILKDSMVFLDSNENLTTFYHKLIFE